MINPDRLTVKATEALNEAVDLARRTGNPLVYDLHLLMALLNQDEGIVVPILQKLGVSVAQLREAVGREMARFPKQSNAQPTLSRELNQVFDRAESDARELGDDFVSAEHFLLALSDVKERRARICSQASAQPTTRCSRRFRLFADRTALPTRTRRTS